MSKTWDEYLVGEHEMIERAIEVLKQELEALEPGSRPSTRLKRAVDFLLEFGDRMHNKKEEEFLFPLMEQRGIPRQGGPIAVMVKEHEMERDLIERPAGRAKVPAPTSDAVAAMMALGYKRSESEKAVAHALDSLGRKASLEQVIREALQRV